MVLVPGPVLYTVEGLTIAEFAVLHANGGVSDANDGVDGWWC